ncbi:MAG TPA: hypothetical protein VIL46_03190 [Gemmataceae bacterium]
MFESLFGGSPAGGTRTRRYTPRVEALEDRAVPSPLVIGEEIPTFAGDRRGEEIPTVPLVWGESESPVNVARKVGISSPIRIGEEIASFADLATGEDHRSSAAAAKGDALDPGTTLHGVAVDPQGAADLLGNRASKGEEIPM